MIGVIVCEQDGIDIGDTSRDELHPQLGRRIDQNSRPPIDLDDCADPRSPVARIRRAAHGTSASELRNAE